MSAKLDQLELSPFHTKIEGFHQIIAAYINSQLKQQWAASEKLQHLEIMLPPCELKKRVKGKLLADTGPMQIQLGVEAENHTVYCHLHLTKGQSVVYEGDEDTSISIDNWVVVLKANVNLLSEDMERVPERITKRLGNAGHYSIKKLILDFGTAGTVDYDEEKSHLPGLHDANNWTRTSQRVLQLRKILHEWTKFLTPRSILGYSVETPNPQSVYPSAPTLVPTSMAHQNYPYLATRLQAPVSDLYGPNRDIANNNMFLYLEMTGNKPLPTVALNSHANWVVNEPGQTPKDGTLAIAKLYFFDRYLLPRLATINRDTALRAINADNDGYDLVQIEFHFELGKLFDKQSDPSLDQWKSTGKPLHWEFEHSSLKQSENLTAMAKLLGINGSLACYIKNELQVIPASNQIRIKGYTKVAKVRNANFINGGNYTYEQNWSITIELDSVEKAGLVAKSTVDVSAPRQEKNAHGHLFAQDDELHATFLRQQIQGALHLEDTIKSLNSVLGGAWDFYFPGTGVFVLKNPKFNMEGDLLAELSYVEGTGA